MGLLTEPQHFTLKYNTVPWNIARIYQGKKHEAEKNENLILERAKNKNLILVVLKCYC